MLDKKYSIGIALGACLLIAAVLHGWNMFHYPYYEGDEGIYVSQAWSVIKEGKLSPYTYWYDHPPLGWITMGLWGGLFGGNFFVFGESSIDNMRVLMLFVHLASASLVFYIARRMTKNTAIAVCATLFFTLSPIFIYYQRRVLLDNLMTLWLLGSLALLYLENLRFRHVLISGIFFGCALLTKIPAIVFLPGLLLVLATRKLGLTIGRRFALWLFAAFCIGMIFIGYTIIKGEFLPPSVTGRDNVSFISGTLFQLDRDSEHFFWHPESLFRMALDDWLRKDSMTVIVMSVGIMIAFVGAKRQKSLRIIALFVALYLLFLMRGGVVTNFHILPLVPFAAIACAMAFWWLVTCITKQDEKRMQIYIVSMVILFSVLFIGSKKDFLISDETSQFNNAITWIKENIDEDQSVIMDVQGLVDLRDPRNINEKSFERADWFSKVFHDGLIRDYKYEADANNIDYMLLSHEHLRQLGSVDAENIAKIAFDSAAPVKDWTGGAGHVNERAFQSQIGDWAKLYKTNELAKKQIEEFWRDYKERFIFSYGQVTSEENDTTTPGDQAHAMILATLVHDQATFDQLWQWTKDHFQYRSDRLFSREWVGQQRTQDGNNIRFDATFAAALLMGYEKWGDEKYRTAAGEIIADIWDLAVIKEAEGYYILPTGKGADVYKGDYYSYDPTVVTIPWYTLFAQYDDNDWRGLIESERARLLAYAGEDPAVTWVWVAKDGSERIENNQRGNDVDTESLSDLSDAELFFWYTSLDYSIGTGGNDQELMDILDARREGRGESKDLATDEAFMALNAASPQVRATIIAGEDQKTREELASKIRERMTNKDSQEYTVQSVMMWAVFALSILDDPEKLNNWQ